MKGGREREAVGVEEGSGQRVVVRESSPLRLVSGAISDVGAALLKSCQHIVHSMW